VVGGLAGRHHQRRLAPVTGAEPTARLADMAVHGVAGDVQATPDLLGPEVLGDEPQALALARRQPLDRLLHVLVQSPHG